MSSIFISYRRSDSPNSTGRLQDALVEHFGAERVFVDVTSLVDGVKYKEAIDAELAQCAVLLVVIGPRWLSLEDGAGKRKIDHDDDIVRHEIRTAFARGIPVIPILVDGASLPRASDLPAELRELPDRQARMLVYERWQADVRDLMHALERHDIPPAPDSADLAAALAGDHDGTAGARGLAREGAPEGWRARLRFVRVPIILAASLIALGGFTIWAVGKISVLAMGGGTGDLKPTELTGKWSNGSTELEITPTADGFTINAISTDTEEPTLEASGRLEGRVLKLEGKLGRRGSGHGEITLEGEVLKLSLRLDGSDRIIAATLTRDMGDDEDYYDDDPRSAALDDPLNLMGWWTGAGVQVGIQRTIAGYSVWYTPEGSAEMPWVGHGQLVGRTLRFGFESADGEVGRASGELTLADTGGELRGSITDDGGIVLEVRLVRGQ